MIFTIEVNNKTIRAKRGDTILETLIANGISVPTLCRMQGFTPTGACRMCVVEVEGKPDLVTSCSHPVEEWMKIYTHSPRVINARRTLVELLLSSHPDDCLYCIRNKNCELQDLAEELGIRERRLPTVRKQVKKDPSSVSLTRDPAKCILCGRCVRVCKDLIGVSTLDFIGKGMKMIVGPTFNNNLNISNCITCGQCIMVCPTGALHERDNVSQVIEALQNPDKYVVVQISPSISVSLAEEFGLRAGKELDGLLVATLRRIGFRKIFKTAFAADLMLMLMADELIERMEHQGPLPMFSSSCPAFVKFIEQTYPDLIPHLSVVKSPQQLMGSLIKHHFSREIRVKPEKIVSVSLAPCTAAKFEAQRDEFTARGISDVDIVITTRELIRMIKLFGIDIHQLTPEMADAPFSVRSSAAKMTGVPGGLTEAFYRTLYFRLTGKHLMNFKLTPMRSNKSIKELVTKTGKVRLALAAVNGLANAMDLIKKARTPDNEWHFIEVMACPGSCISGGGQPFVKKNEEVRARIKTIYDLDDKDSIKVPDKNLSVREMFSRYQEKEKELLMQKLYTTYHERKVLL